MVSKTGLIFLLALTAGISFGNLSENGVKCKIPKRENLPSIDIKKVSKNITELVNLVTLWQTLNFWGDSKFFDCLEKASPWFFIPEVELTLALTSSLQDFNSTANEENRGLAHEICGLVNENFNIMEKARRTISDVAKKRHYTLEDLLTFLSSMKKELILNFQDIDKNLLKIQSGDYQPNEDGKLGKILEEYEKYAEKLKSASKKVVYEIQRCIKF